MAGFSLSLKRPQPDPPNQGQIGLLIWHFCSFLIWELSSAIQKVSILIVRNQCLFKTKINVIGLSSNGFRNDTLKNTHAPHRQSQELIRIVMHRTDMIECKFSTQTIRLTRLLKSNLVDDRYNRNNTTPSTRDTTLFVKSTNWSLWIKRHSWSWYARLLPDWKFYSTSLIWNTWMVQELLLVEQTWVSTVSGFVPKLLQLPHGTSSFFAIYI